MGIFSRGKKDSPGEPGGSGADAFQLTVQYVKQETLQPLQGLLAALRILQTETGAFHGNLSWLPYVIVSALAAVIMVLAAWRITHGAAARRGPAPVPGGASEKE